MVLICYSGKDISILERELNGQKVNPGRIKEIE